MGKERINIVIIDQNHFIREGLHYLLSKEIVCNVLESSDHHAILKYIAANKQIDLLLIDIHEYKEKHQQINAICEQFKLKTKIIVMISAEDEASLDPDVQSAIHGIIDKAISVEDFLHVLELVVSSDFYVQPFRMNKWQLFTRQNEGKLKRAHAKLDRPEHLYTSREWEIIELLAKGYRNQEIANHLKISDKTVKNHVSNVFKRMQVNDRVKVVLHAIRNQWVEI